MARDSLSDPMLAGCTIDVIAKAHGFPEPAGFRAPFAPLTGRLEARTGLSPSAPYLGFQQRRGVTAWDVAARP